MKYRMRKALIDIWNQTCVSPSNLEDAQVTLSCISDILEEVRDLITYKHTLCKECDIWNQAYDTDTCPKCEPANRG
jgi:hypothetical protein